MTQTFQTIECDEENPSFIDRLLVAPYHIFAEFDTPHDSGPAAYWDMINNIWFDDDGLPLRDLKEMGFSARMRETILIYIHQHIYDRYVGLINDWGDWVELFW